MTSQDKAFIFVSIGIVVAAVVAVAGMDSAQTTDSMKRSETTIQQQAFIKPSTPSAGQTGMSLGVEDDPCDALCGPLGIPERCEECRKARDSMIEKSNLLEKSTTDTSDKEFGGGAGLIETTRTLVLLCDPSCSLTTVANFETDCGLQGGEIDDDLSYGEEGFKGSSSCDIDEDDDDDDDDVEPDEGGTKTGGIT